MDPSHAPWLLTSVLFTSTVSGTFGMAGGMMLMAVYVWLLPVPEAMVLHGVTQLASNGSRAWLHRHAIQRPVLGPYLAGAAVAVTGFLVVRLSLPRGPILLILGSLPFAALLTRRLPPLDPNRPRVAAGCGILVTGAQLAAGVSGPLLDVFFIRAPLAATAVVATKAVTQTLGHLLKLGYYGMERPSLPWPIYPAVVVTAFIGTNLGRKLLSRLPENAFRSGGQALMLAIGLVCLVRGIGEYR